MYEMNEWEKKLVEALRSGKYKQTDSMLRRDHGNGGFCCLGVACDIVDPTKWIWFEQPDGDDGQMKENDDAWLFDSDELLPPLYISDLYGWKEVGGILAFVCRHEKPLSLHEINDAGCTFDQIADVIAAGLVLHKDEDHP